MTDVITLRFYEALFKFCNITTGRGLQVSNEGPNMHLDYPDLTSSVMPQINVWKVTVNEYLDELSDYQYWDWESSTPRPPAPSISTAKIKQASEMYGVGPILWIEELDKMVATPTRLNALLSLVNAVYGAGTSSAGMVAVHVNCNSACGNVDYREDGVEWGTVALDGAGNVVSDGNFPNKSIGTHTVTVTYLGNSQYAGSTSNTVSFSIVANGSSASTIMATISSTSFTASAPGMVSVHVSCNTACGNIDYREDGADWATVALDASGNFVSDGNFPDKSVGQHTVTVNYLGNSQYAPSSSNTVSFSIVAPTSANVQPASMGVVSEEVPVGLNE